MGIDLLDIVYRLEKAFSIKIERDDLIPVDIFNDTQGKYVVNGELTILGLKEIKRRMPSANLSSFEKKPTIQSLATILTVGTLCDLVENKISEKNKEVGEFPNALLQVSNSVSETLSKQFNISDTPKIERNLRLEQLARLSDSPLPSDAWRRFHKIRRTDPDELKSIKTCARSLVLISIWKTSYSAIIISLVCGLALWLCSAVWLHNIFWINDVLYLSTVLFVLAPIIILFGVRFVVNWKRCGRASRVTVGEIIDYLVDRRPDHSIRADGLPYSRSEIERIVGDTLCEALAVEPKEVRPEARIFHDLGAE